MPKLLMLAPAPVIALPDQRTRLDVKFVEGMADICRNWPGSVHCVLRSGATAIPFGRDLDPTTLPFKLTVLNAGEAVPDQIIADCDIIEASGDTHLDLDLAGRLKKMAAKCVFVIEYTLGTRLRILQLERGISPLRKLKSGIWLLQQESRRRSAMKGADGVQTNGYPAFDRYHGLNANTLIYLDNRMRSDMMSDPAEVQARIAALRQGGPLRLIHSGRLETMKGAQDLIPVARALTASGVNFTLDIYGTGSLEDEIRSSIAASGLGDRVRLHAPVDFETELVPISRRNADMFLSCHRQSDPSCTYLEAMGCGLPVVGYSNDMLTRLVQDSQGGWTVPQGDTAKLAQRLGQLAGNADAVLEASLKALNFAREHDFNTEFARRRQHLLQVANAA